MNTFDQPRRRKVFTPWGEQIVRGGHEIGGRTGAAIGLVGMVVGLAISLFWLTVVAVIASIFVGNIAWVGWALVIAFAVYRSWTAYQEARSRG